MLSFRKLHMWHASVGGSSSSPWAWLRSRENTASMGRLHSEHASLRM